MIRNIAIIFITLITLNVSAHAQDRQSIDGLSPNQIHSIFDSISSETTLRRSSDFYITSSYAGLDYFILPFRCVDTNPRRTRSDADEWRCTAVRLLSVYRGEIPEAEVINDFNSRQVLVKAYTTDQRLILVHDMLLSGADNLALRIALDNFLTANETIRAIVASENYDINSPVPSIPN